MRKQLILFFFSFNSGFLIAQNYCDCETIKYNKEFNGYCNEYLDSKLRIVKKKSAIFKMFSYYEKGAGLMIYPYYYSSRGAKQNVYNNLKVVKSDSISLLDGLLESFNKFGIRTSVTYFKNGHIIKLINYNWGILRRADRIGSRIHEISEYYYLNDKIEFQIISFKYNGSIKFNVYFSSDEFGKWTQEPSTIILNDDPLKLSK